MAELKLKHLKSGNVNWHITPIVGLEIQDQDNWRDFIFGDATIVNKKQLYDYLNNEEKFKEMANPFVDNPNQTYLILQTAGDFKNGKNIDFKDEIKHRFLEVIGFINFVFLYLTDFKYTICFYSSLFSINQDYVETYTSKGGINTTNFQIVKDYPIQVIDKYFNYSREKLIEVFSKNYFKNLFEIVKNKKSKFTEIKSALIQFYLTSNIPSPISQLLGCVTSIEILLKNNDEESYDNIEKRMEVLEGDEFIKNFIKKTEKADGVLKTRHKVIHQGIICSANDAYRAIVVATTILISYSFFTKQFKNKIEILRHLDLIYQIKKDDGLKTDKFNILNQWNELIEYDKSHFDWVIRRLINYHQLCINKTNTIEKLNFAEVVVRYQKIRNYKLEKCFDLISNAIYYNLIPFKNFKGFLSYCSKNKVIIDTAVNKSEKDIKFEL